MEIVALIASIVAIFLAFFAIWQANHHRDQSDKLNRDTTEKLARIEAFATSTKEDAFKELERWGDFARSGGKASEEVEKAKEEEIRKLKDEMQATTSAEINKVLETVESKLKSFTQPSTISEIKKEFEELKKQLEKIQLDGLGEIKKQEIEKKFWLFWLVLPLERQELLVKAMKDPIISKEAWERAGFTNRIEVTLFGYRLIHEGIVAEALWIEPGVRYQIKLTPSFRQFLESVK